MPLGGMFVPPNCLTLSKNKKHPLGACWCHPIGAPHMLNPKVFFLGQATRIDVSHRKCFLTNCLEGKERKLDGAAQKVGRLCLHVQILSACLPFCQRISRSRQAEPRVFEIVRAPHLPNHHLRISWCDNCRLKLTSPKPLQNPGTL